MYWAWYRRKKFITIRTKGKSAKQLKIVDSGFSIQHVPVLREHTHDTSKIHIDTCRHTYHLVSCRGVIHTCGRGDAFSIYTCADVKSLTPGRGLEPVMYRYVSLRKDGEGCGNGARGALGWRYTHPVLVSAPQGRWLPSLSGVYTYVART